MNKISLKNIFIALVIVAFVVSGKLSFDKEKTDNVPLSLETIKSQNEQIKECLLARLNQNKESNLYINTQLVKSDLDHCSWYTESNAFAMSQEKALKETAGDK